MIRPGLIPPFGRDFMRYLRLPLSRGQARLIRTLEAQRFRCHAVRIFIDDLPGLSTPVISLSALMAAYLRWINTRVHHGRRSAILAASSAEARRHAALIGPRALASASCRVDTLRGRTFQSLLILDAHRLRRSHAGFSFSRVLGAMMPVLNTGCDSIAIVIGDRHAYPRRPFASAFRAIQRSGSPLGAWTRFGLSEGQPPAPPPLAVPRARPAPCPLIYRPLLRPPVLPALMPRPPLVPIITYTHAGARPAA